MLFKDLKLISVQKPIQDSSGNTTTPVIMTDRAGSTSPMKHSIDKQPHTSAAAFASSGFAAFSKSSTSPFGTLGTLSTLASASSPHGGSIPISASDTSTSEGVELRKVEPTTNGGFGTFTKVSSKGFGSSEPSLFATSSAIQSRVFGGSVFGSGFGGGFGGGKLTNFAAPSGDTNLGKLNDANKPIGSPTRDRDDVDDDENSNDEDNGSADNELEENDEVDNRFQHQDGKPLNLM